MSENTDLIALPDSWTLRKISDISERVSVGFVGITSPYFTNAAEGVPLIRSQNIRNGKINFQNLAYITKEFHKKNKKSVLKSGDVIVVRVGENRGDTCILKDEFTEVNCANVVFFRPQKEYGKFVELFLRSRFGQHSLLSMTTGSAQGVINTKSVAELMVPIPSKAEALAVSELFESIEGKIDLLQRQNKTLEQLPETLFRQWFVEEAEESWDPGKLDDVISVKGGTTPSTSRPEYWNGNIHWTSPRDLSNHNSIFLFDTERKITEKGLQEIGSGLLPMGTVLLSSRAPIGYLAITEIPVAINQGYIAIICDKLVSNYFIYLWCKANMQDIENSGNGSVFQEISKSTFREMEIKIPSNEKLKMFDNEVEPMFQKIKSNTIQIKTLTQLRDSLLPKLMSGEVRVKM